jgi:hypothetical protein
MRALPFTAATSRGIHALITIELFAATLRLTTADFDIVLGGFTWKASAAVNITQILYSTDGTPTAADIRISPDGTTLRAGVAARGLFDGRPVKIEIFDVANPSAGTYDMVPNAIVGSIQEDSNGVVVLAAQGPLAFLRGPMTEVQTITCKARFGDDRCHIPLDVPVIGRGVAFVTQATPSLFVRTRDVWGRVLQSGSYHDLAYECTTAGTTHASVQPTYPTVVGGTVTDGTAVFTARAAWLVAAVGQALTFFDIQLTATPNPEPTILGNIIPQDGPLAGLKIPIRAFDSGTNIVTSFEPFAPANFPVGTNFLIHRGCDKILETCRDDFENLNNYQGTPYAPGADFRTGRS